MGRDGDTFCRVQPRKKSIRHRTGDSQQVIGFQPYSHSNQSLSLIQWAAAQINCCHGNLKGLQFLAEYRY